MKSTLKGAVACLTAWSFVIVPSLAYILNSQPVRADDDSDSIWEFHDTSNEADASDVVLPLFSLFLPGLGQWVRGQYTSGAVYTSVAIGAGIYAIDASHDFNPDELNNDLSNKNVAIRKYTWGNQVIQATGGFSLYHTFRSAVWQRQKHDQYKFLVKSETPAEILASPFHFSYLGRFTTWIPLSVGALLSWYIANNPGPDYRKDKLSSADYAFSGAFSYTAGTHEEAVFRGWLMPVVHQYGLSDGFSNLTQATAFALAHLGTVQLPLPQFLLGLHLGNVTQRNSWSISESIFIHTWWDVITFLGSYEAVKSTSAQFALEHPFSPQPKPILFLPPLVMAF